MDASSWFNVAKYQLNNGSTAIPAFLSLADEGYDVWMGNNRGTKYSNVNPRFPYADDPSDARYQEQNFAKYDFSWQEFGKSDVPAMLKKIK